MRTPLAVTVEYLRFNLFTGDHENQRHGILRSFWSSEVELQVARDWVRDPVIDGAQSTGRSTMQLLSPAY